MAKEKVTALVRTYVLNDGQVKVVYIDARTMIFGTGINQDKKIAEKIARNDFVNQFQNIVSERSEEVEVDSAFDDEPLPTEEREPTAVDPNDLPF